MIDDIRVAVNELLDEVDWMDEKTKIVAQEKVGHVAIYSIRLNDTYNRTFLKSAYPKN